MTETNIFDRLLDSTVFIENKFHGNCIFLLCGDFNSRTSNNPDFVIDDDTLHMSVLPDDYVSDTQIPRYSQDEGHTNSNGLLFLDFCRQTGLRIMNGRVGNDEGVGKYTFVGSRGSSLVDYVLASQDMFYFVKYFCVQDPNILSDHCLINMRMVIIWIIMRLLIVNINGTISEKGILYIYYSKIPTVTNYLH